MKKTLALAVAAASLFIGAPSASTSPPSAAVVDVGVDPLPAAQMKLRSWGYTTDPIGTFGPQTERAIRHVQRANRLPQTGALDAPTLSIMGLGGAIPPAPPAPPPAPVLDPPTAPVPGPGGTTVPGRCVQYETTMAAAGWSSTDVAWLSTITWRESRCNPSAYNGRHRDRSYGLTQINTRGALWGEIQQRCGLVSRDQLFDPLTNLTCAKRLHDAYGRRPWRK